MQNLREQLLKAGVIDKKKKRHADRESKAERRKKGARTVAAEEHGRAKAHDEKVDEQRRTSRERDEMRKSERAVSDALHRVREIAKRGVVREGRRGNRRFYFVSRQGRIPSVTISDELALRLEQGSVAIVELPLESSESFEIIERGSANKISETHKDYVLFCN